MTVSQAVHQLSGSCSDQEGCGRSTVSSAVAEADMRLVFIQQNGLDRTGSNIETDKHEVTFLKQVSKRMPRRPGGSALGKSELSTGGNSRDGPETAAGQIQAAAIVGLIAPGPGIAPGGHLPRMIMPRRSSSVTRSTLPCRPAGRFS
jgi:hypothetical protein